MRANQSTRRTATLAALLALAGVARAETPGAEPSGATPRQGTTNGTTASDASTPLHWAAYRGDATEVKRLLAAGANVADANAYGVTALAIAAETGNTEVIRLLLAAGANVESPTGDGQTALMSVARTGNVEAAQLLIKRGANVNATEQFGGQTALMWAAARRQSDMVKLLASKGADVNARAIVRNFERHITQEQRYKNTHSGGLTPLLYAIRENCRACVDELLRRGASVNLPDPDGIAPLTLAMMNGNWDIARRLVEAGADVNQWDIYGQSPLHVAIENTYVSRRSGLGNLGTDKSANVTDGKTLVKMLVERGADPNQQMFFRPPREPGQVSASTRGTTPFHRACASADPEIITYLLDHGADIKLTTAHGETPILVVVNARSNEDEIIRIVRLLKEKGADINGVAQVIWYNRNRGGSALHLATRKNMKKLMAELVALGENPDLKDGDGLTALDYAQSRGWLPALSVRPLPRDDLVKVLKDLGASVEMNRVPDWAGEFPAIGPPRGHESEILPL